MTQRDEQISALLDDALSAEELNELMQDLKRDHLEDAERIQRYQLASDAMKGELNNTSFMDISAAVHRAIEQEPVPEMQSAKVVSKKSFDFSAWLRPLTGMAVAASVAVVTVVAFKTVQTEATDPATPAIAQLKPQTAITPVNPVIAQQVRVASTLNIEKNTQENHQQLNDYMIKHSGAANQSTMQGMMPYVRVVSFGTDSNK